MKKLAPIMALLLALFSLVLGGCSGRESTLSPDQNAYVWFTGDAKGVTATIDGQGPIALTPNYTTDANGQRKGRLSEVHYEIEPGKHTIKLFRGGMLILERVVLIGNHMTKEIQIP